MNDVLKNIKDKQTKISGKLETYYKNHEKKEKIKIAEKKTDSLSNMLGADQALGKDMQAEEALIGDFRRLNDSLNA
jgi:hypothetical protein